MNRVVLSLLTYLGGIVIACGAVAATSYPFLEAGDFSIGLEVLVMVVLSGFYLLAFTPFVILGELLVRKLVTHRMVPLLAFPIFGALFPALGFWLFPGRWWPEEPFDMKSAHLLVFLPLALFSVGVGIGFTWFRCREIASVEANFPEENST